MKWILIACSICWACALSLIMLKIAIAHSALFTNSGNQCPDASKILLRSPNPMGTKVCTRAFLGHKAKLLIFKYEPLPWIKNRNMALPRTGHMKHPERKKGYQNLMQTNLHGFNNFKNGTMITKHLATKCCKRSKLISSKIVFRSE